MPDLKSIHVVFSPNLILHKLTNGFPQNLSPNHSNINITKVICEDIYQFVFFDSKIVQNSITCKRLYLTRILRNNKIEFLFVDVGTYQYIFFRFYLKPLKIQLHVNSGEFTQKQNKYLY